MLKIITVLFFGLVLANAILTDVEEWHKFKSQNHKLYQSQDEETYRLGVFKKNLEKIREHNEMYARGESTYLMGVNKFTDLTDEEFKAIYGRGILPPKEPVYA